MDVISDVFHPTVPSVMDHIWGFFAGVRQRGVQSTEKMLRKGTMITGIGELSTASDGSLKLQPPANGAPFYLTTMQVTSLVKKLDVSKRKYKLLILLFGTVGLVITGLIFRKYWRWRKYIIEEEKRKKEIEKTRRERRRRMRDEQVPENQLCIVCKTNPLEVKNLNFIKIKMFKNCFTDYFATLWACLFM